MELIKAFSPFRDILFPITTHKNVYTLTIFLSKEKIQPLGASHDYKSLLLDYNFPLIEGEFGIYPYLIYSIPDKILMDPFYNVLTEYSIVENNTLVKKNKYPIPCYKVPISSNAGTLNHIRLFEKIMSFYYSRSFNPEDPIYLPTLNFIKKYCERDFYSPLKYKKYQNAMCDKTAFLFSNWNLEDSGVIFNISKLTELFLRFPLKRVRVILNEF